MKDRAATYKKKVYNRLASLITAMYVSLKRAYKLVTRFIHAYYTTVSYSFVVLVAIVLYSLEMYIGTSIGNEIIVLLFLSLIVFASWRVGFGQGLFAAFFSAFLQFYQEYVIRGDSFAAVRDMNIYILFGVFVSMLHVLQKRHEQELLRQKQYFHGLVDHTPYPIVVEDTEGSILFASKSIRNVFEFEEKDLIGKRIADFVASEDRERFHIFHKKLLSQKSHTLDSIEVRIQNKSGTWLWMRKDVVYLLKNSNIEGIAATYQDVTAQKRIDAQRVQSIFEEKKARQLAEEAVRARDEFLSIASHELKTPLTTVIIKLQTTLRNILSQSLANFSGEKLVASLTIAEEQSQRLAKLIADLLNVSLISTGKINLELKRADLNNIVVSVLSHFDEHIKAAGTTLSTIIDKPVIGLWDQVRIEQAVSNLLTNALNYGEGKPVRVAVQQNGNIAFISVTDGGVGIKPADQKVIFQRFKRVNVKDNNGLGIGLFIVEQIAKAHGGDVQVVSSPGKGAMFTLRLPIREQS